MLIIAIVGFSPATATLAENLDLVSEVSKVELTAEEMAFAAGLAMVLAEEKARVEAEELRVKQEIEAVKQAKIDAAFDAGVAAAKAQLKVIADAKAEAVRVAETKAIAEAEAQRIADIQARADSFVSFKSEFKGELTSELNDRIERLKRMLDAGFNKQITEMQSKFDSSISNKNSELKSLRSDFDSQVASIKFDSAQDMKTLQNKLNIKIDSIDQLKEDNAVALKDLRVTNAKLVEQTISNAKAEAISVSELNYVAVSRIESDRDAITVMLADANVTISNMTSEATQVKTMNDSIISKLQSEVASISKEATEVIAKVQADAQIVIKQEATKLTEKFAQLEIDAFNRGVVAAQEAQAKSAEQATIDTEARAAELRAKIALIEKNKQTELDIKNARVAEIQARLSALSSI